MKLIYTDHLKLRLILRKIPYEYPELIYRKPDQIFYDRAEGYTIAIKKLQYNYKLRNMMIAYEEKQENIEIVTIHPISDEQIINRTINQRWTKHE